MFNTVSNYISLFRIVLCFPLAFTLYYGYPYWAIGIALFGAFTDFLDGYFARKLNQISEWGKILDPLGDKLMIGTGAVMLLVLEIMPLWFGIIIVARDVLIFLGGIYARKKLGYVIPSNWTGKITVNVVSLVIFGLILENKFSYDYGMYIASAFLIFSFLNYLYGMIKKIRAIIPV